MKAHDTTPSEFLYLETGAIPIEDDNELVKKVYIAKQESNVFGDFAQHVRTDLLNIKVTQAKVETLPRNDLKKLLTFFINLFIHLFTQNNQ